MGQCDMLGLLHDVSDLNALFFAKNSPTPVGLEPTASEYL